MKKETYEAQRAFAGEKKPSMLRRCVGHDYTGRQIYMITMVTEGRRPLFGQVAGRSDAPEGSDEMPHIELSELGQRVADEWWAASLHHPEIEVIALQMMPDHLHGILFVKEKMEKPLGMALRGNARPVCCVANATNKTRPPRRRPQPRLALCPGLQRQAPASRGPARHLASISCRQPSPSVDEARASRPVPRAAQRAGRRHHFLCHRQPLPAQPPCSFTGAVLAQPYRGRDTSQGCRVPCRSTAGRGARLACHLAWRKSRHACCLR